MAATNLYMNWKSVTWTPNGGSPTTLPQIVEADFDRGSDPREWAADAAKYPTLIVAHMQHRTCTLRTGALNLALSIIAPDTPGTIVAVLEDAVNTAGGTGSGQATFTLTNAILYRNPMSDSHNQFANSTLTFGAFAPDGATDPLTVVIA